jgi:hypothetical protein
MAEYDRRMKRRPLVRCCFWLAIVLALAPEMASAGGGPENVLLVVNRRSWASISVANHYIQLRNLPSQNVVYLDWPATAFSASVDEFRSQILRPVLTSIEKNELDDHIDYVVYSSDFPVAIHAHGDTVALKLPNYLTPIGSLTGMTYLWPLVWSRRPDWLALNSNYYVRPAEPSPGIPTTHAFRSWYGWSEQGKLLEAGGRHYMLSTALAVTSGRGNSLAEVVEYLSRSVQADGTLPKGTIYFDETTDIRSKCRTPLFGPAIDELRRLGVAGEVDRDAVPLGRPDVQGVMAGVADFDWARSLSRIQPGAICESLTSGGAWLSYGDPQTPLTEWLRYGAAGSSGTVAEPYLLQAKFPLPQMHVHYARGSSLAEAYYQAVAAPYQLLIVGDPLCQPWARRPRVAIAGLEAGESVRGKRAIRAVVSPSTADRVEWFLDGHRMAIASPEDRVNLDGGSLADGFHELRAVASENNDIEAQGHAVVAFSAGAGSRHVELTASTRAPRWNEELTLSCKAEGASRILICQQTRVLGKIAGEQGSLAIQPQTIGLGPVRLEALAIYDGQPRPVRSAALHVDVGPGDYWPAIKLAVTARLVPGFEFTVADGRPQVVPISSGLDWMTKYGGAAGTPFVISGVVDARTDDVYQFQLRFYGALDCEVDGRQIFRGHQGDFSVQYVPVPLAAGLHRVRLFGTLGTPASLGVQFGNRGLEPLSGALLQRVVGP